MDLGLGSVLNGTAALLSNDVNYTAVATEQTVVHCIPTKLLEKIAKTAPRLSQRIEELKAENLIYDQYRESDVNIS